MQKTRSINGVASELRVQVSAQNTCCRECTLMLHVLTSDSSGLALVSDLDCQQCCKVAFLTLVMSRSMSVDSTDDLVEREPR